MTRAYKMHQKSDIHVFDPACDGVPVAKQNEEGHEVRFSPGVQSFSVLIGDQTLSLLQSWDH